MFELTQCAIGRNLIHGCCMHDMPYLHMVCVYVCMYVYIYIYIFEDREWLLYKMLCLRIMYIYVCTHVYTCERRVNIREVSTV